MSEDQVFKVYGEYLERILLWYEEKSPSFNPAFVHSLQAQLKKKGHLTDKQMLAIDRIIEGYKINEWYDEYVNS